MEMSGDSCNPENLDASRNVFFYDRKIQLA